MRSWAPPVAFDGYELGELLGEGGMGVVYAAHDTLLDREVAVKLISTADADEVARERFVVEARAVARIQHPNVVSIYRVGEVDGHPYLVSELIHGEGLDRLPKPVPWERALQIATGIARGLATAHHRGVVHRDIKPANVILSEDGEPKLLDFGIAKLLDASGQLEPRAPRPGPSAPLAAPVDSPTEDDATRPVAAAEGLADDATNPVAAAAALDDAAPSGPAGQGLTRRGLVMGTPLYLAPELWQGQVATFRADVYSLGALLYELCSGAPPHTAASTSALGEQVRTRDARPLGEVVPAIDARFAAIVDRCLRRDPSQRYASGNEVRAALAQLTEEARSGVVPAGNPYRGLHAFDAEHRSLFFGRDSEIRGILELLAAGPLVVVAGDSGVGKSSLCRAGVLPKFGAWAPGRAWVTRSLVPGRRPLAALSAALCPHLGLDEATLSRRLLDEPGAAARLLRGSLGADKGLVLFIDQLEELVTLSEPEEASAVAAVLAWLAEPSPSIRVLAAVRGDFVVRVAGLPAVGDALLRALYVVRPLTRERIREAIVGPARALGVTFASEDMIGELVESTARAEGGLPLLQFVLAQLWDARARDKAVISAESLVAMGGVAGALSRHADELVARLLPQHVERARGLLLALVTTQGTRARKTEEELVRGDPATRSVLQALVDGRILVGRDTAAGAGYEVAHEALLHSWSTLARWLSDDAGGRAAHERLAQAAAEWRRLGRPPELLWRKAQLGELGRVADAELSAEEAAFVTAARRAERRARAPRVAALTVVPLLLGVVYGATVLQARRDLAGRVQAHLDEATRIEARVASELTRRQELRTSAFELFDRPLREDAERTWESARAATAQLERSLAEASRELEAASLLEPSRADVRDRFADLLYTRALVADEEHQTTARDELLSRLVVYDAGGARGRLWSAPGHLAVQTTPPGARVRLARYVSDASGRRSLEAERDLGPAPQGDLLLEQGSYLVTVEQAGRAVVRAPALLGRDERVLLALHLPRASDVPRGFVYVPEGRFLFGSAAEDGIRRTFFNTAPLHEVTTGAFLIAAHETTFGDWLDYLRALPPSERAARRPGVERGGFQGGLTLTESPAGVFAIALQPAGTTLTAGPGEPIVYPGRARRREQDWLRLPVVGVDVEAVGGYLRWLAGSGRVPGARLCSEREWERAARGADGRAYPHGDALAPDDANIDDTYEKAQLGFGPDEVGSHPASRSPFGLDDLAGNAWEWTLSALAPAEHVVRGSSYYYDAKSARAENREVSEPSLRDVGVGLRVCADAPAP